MEDKKRVISESRGIIEGFDSVNGSPTLSLRISVMSYESGSIEDAVIRLPYTGRINDAYDLVVHEGDSKVTISFDTQEIKKESNLLFDIGSEYKAGDQVWYFDNTISPSVCLCDILYVGQVDGRKRYRISETNGRNIGLVPGSLLFSTREDLLYYYLQKLIPWRYGRDGRIHY